MKLHETVGGLTMLTDEDEIWRRMAARADDIERLSRAIENEGSRCVLTCGTICTFLWETNIFAVIFQRKPRYGKQKRIRLAEICNYIKLLGHKQHQSLEANGSMVWTAQFKRRLSDESKRFALPPDTRTP